MKIIKINRPNQDEQTKPEDVQAINDSNSLVKWCVKTEMIREKDGGWIKWLNDKDEFCNSQERINGIYLYDIKALKQEIHGDGVDIIYYIRYDWVKDN